MSNTTRKDEVALAKARSNARSALASSMSFTELSESDQIAVYRNRVDEEYNKLTKTNQHSRGMALGEEKIIDDSRMDNKNLDKQGQHVQDLLDSVDFPDFVKELLTSVFEANVQANIDQMEAYQSMLKKATKSLSSYIKEVSPEQSFAYLAENNSDEFSLSFPSMDDENKEAIILTDKDGNPVDTEDTKIKSKIMDAQIAMAKEQRALVRETVLMGVQRLVVDKGTIKAGLKIDVRASSNVTKTEKGQMDQVTNSNSFRLGAGMRGFGRAGIGFSASKGRKSQVRVSSAAGVEKTDNRAQIESSVEINFKTDYFKLDNFASMYGGDLKQEDKKEKKA